MPPLPVVANVAPASKHIAPGASPASEPEIGRLDPRTVACALGGEARGNSVNFPSPGHSKSDRGSSLTIDPTAPGGFLINSFNGADPLATKDYVRRALNLPQWEPSPQQSRVAGNPASPATAEYIYRDQDGQPSRKVVRKADKSFPQYRWTGVEWKAGAKDLPLLPYRLPEMLDAPAGEPVFICEGEKDADRLAAEGFVSTTNPMGAEKWRPDLNKWFRGRECFVLEDNDEAGRRHAAQVAANLNGVAASVRIVKLPELPDKGDVSDWLDAAPENRSRLIDVARSASTVQASPEKKWPGILTSAEFLANFAAPDYLVDGLIQHGYLYSLTGSTGSGKTAIALLLTASIALGRYLAGREILRSRVLYLAGENPTDVQMRWDAIASEFGFDPRSIDVHFVAGTFDIAGLIETIQEEVRKLGGVGLVIVDTSAAYFLGDEENNNAQLGNHARVLRSLTSLPGHPCIIANCHPVKNAGNDNLIPRGGGAFIAEVDGNLTCSRDDAIIRMHWQGKYRGPDFDALSFELVQTTCATLRDSKGRLLPTVIARALSEPEEAKREEVARSDEDTLLLAMRDNPEASIAALLKATGWPYKSKVSRVMSRLKKDRLVVLKRDHWTLTKLGKAEARKAETPV